MVYTVLIASAAGCSSNEVRRVPVVRRWDCTVLALGLEMARGSIVAAVAAASGSGYSAAMWLCAAASIVALPWLCCLVRRVLVEGLGTRRRVGMDLRETSGFHVGVRCVGCAARLEASQGRSSDFTGEPWAATKTDPTITEKAFGDKPFSVTVESAPTKAPVGGTPFNAERISQHP